MDNRRVQLLTRTGLDWMAKYPGAVAPLGNVKVKRAYTDREIWGVEDAAMPEGSDCGQGGNECRKLSSPAHSAIPSAVSLTFFAQLLFVHTSRAQFLALAVSLPVAAMVAIAGINANASRSNLKILGDRGCGND